MKLMMRLQQQIYLHPLCAGPQHDQDVLEAEAYRPMAQFNNLL